MQNEEPPLHAEGSVVHATRAWVRKSRRFRSLVNVILVLGGTVVSGFGGAMDGGVGATGGDGLLTLKGLLVAGGLASVFLGGVILLLAQDDEPGRLADAIRTIADQTRARIAIANQRHLEARAIGEARNRALVLHRALVNMVALTFDKPLHDRNLHHAIRMFMDFFYNNQPAFGFDEPGCCWTISMFQRLAKPSGGEHLVRIDQTRWEHPSPPPDGRSWERGIGFSGYSWQERETLILSDAQDAAKVLPIIREPASHLSSDDMLFRSVAVVPIRFGQGGDIWGQINVTSNRVGHFAKEQSNTLGQIHADLVRSIASIMSLMIAACDPAVPPPLDRRNRSANFLFNRS